VRVDARGNLVLRYQDWVGKTWTVQTVAPDGSKRFLRGGCMAGHFVAVKPDVRVRGPLVVCEGWATACSIAEATGLLVLAAGTTTNLANVCKAVRAVGPTHPIVVAADDDRKPDGRNPGREAAEAAALEVGATVLLPDFGQDRPAGVSDWNDLHQLAGLDVVRAQFEAVLP
jgi:putative DNA primase/helicase